MMDGSLFLSEPPERRSGAKHAQDLSYQLFASLQK